MKSIIKISVLSVISIMLLTIKSNAAIQIVPTTSIITNVTVSTSYKTCRDLDSLSSTLGTTKLDPHLATNKDWGAVSYLANSAYGLNATYEQCDQGKVGLKKMINEIEFYSTTPNITGVMNWGGDPYTTFRYSQTSSLLSSITDSNEKIDLLFNNKNTKYVESIQSNNTIGMSIGEVSGWGRLNNFYSSNTYPMVLRCGLFGYTVGRDWEGNYTNIKGSGGQKPGSTGGSDSRVTFRPVIWNIE